MAATSTILLGAGLALSAAATGYSMSAANSQAKAQNSIIQENARQNIAELTRQQQEVAQIAAEKKGDRARIADRETSNLRAIMAEKGGLQTANYDSLIGQIGYYEGMDFGRIDANAKATIDGMQTQKERASTGALQQIEMNNRESLNMKVGAGLQLASTAISAGYQYKSRREQEDERTRQRQDRAGG